MGKDGAPGPCRGWVGAKVPRRAGRPFPEAQFSQKWELTYEQQLGTAASGNEKLDHQ